MSEPKPGDKIRFTKEIYQEASDDMPAGIYASRGDIGVFGEHSPGSESWRLAWPYCVECRGCKFCVARDEFEIVEEK